MAKIVVALGGNALQTGDGVSADEQKRVAASTAVVIADLAERGHKMVITHGNGPQVGDILLGEEASASATNAVMPLETTVAMSQGQIGYWLQQAVRNELLRRGVLRDVVSVVTQVVVDRGDPAFADPTKPIGPFYTEAEARELAGKNGWVVREDAGRGWRRVVPSPKPVDIVEIETIGRLVEQGTMVIAAGGGGVPVVVGGGADGSGGAGGLAGRYGVLSGVDAVIDKDFAAAKLAEGVGAEVLMILTAVDNVSINYRMAEERVLGEVSVAEMEGYIADGQFAAGSMLPKVEAAVGFVRGGGGRRAIVTSMGKAVEALGGGVGTVVVGNMVVVK